MNKLGNWLLGFARLPPISALKIVRQFDDRMPDYDVSHPMLPPVDHETKPHAAASARLVESVISPITLPRTPVISIEGTQDEEQKVIHHYCRPKDLRDSD